MSENYRHSVKAVREKFKNNGVFYTPPELAEMMKSFLPQDIDEIYDPTCGNGNLLSAFGDDVKKYGQEINKQRKTKDKKTKMRIKKNQKKASIKHIFIKFFICIFFNISKASNEKHRKYP